MDAVIFIIQVTGFKIVPQPRAECMAAIAGLSGELRTSMRFKPNYGCRLRSRKRTPLSSAPRRALNEVM